MPMQDEFLMFHYFSVTELIANRKMSDGEKLDAERNCNKQINDGSSTSIDGKPSSKRHMAEENKTAESNGMVTPVDEAVDENIRELLNILIDGDVDGDTKTERFQGKMERKKALTKKRLRTHDQEMLYEKGHKYKKMFDELLDKKKVSDYDRKSKTFNELCNILKPPPKSLYEERAKFYKAKMSYNETMDEYFQRLTDLSSNCQFGERQSFVIADKFILSRSSVYYAFCGENQKEIGGKKALKISKQNNDQRVNMFS